MEESSETPKPPDNPVVPNPATAPLHPPITPSTVHASVLEPQDTPSIPPNSIQDITNVSAAPKATPTLQSLPPAQSTPTYDSKPVAKSHQPAERTPISGLSDQGKSGRGAYAQSVVAMTKENSTPMTITTASLINAGMESVIPKALYASRSEAHKGSSVRELPTTHRRVASGSGSGISLVFKVPPGSIGENSEDQGVQVAGEGNVKDEGRRANGIIQNAHRVRSGDTRQETRLGSRGARSSSISQLQGATPTPGASTPTMEAVIEGRKGSSTSFGPRPIKPKQSTSDHQRRTSIGPVSVSDHVPPSLPSAAFPPLPAEQPAAEPTQRSTRQATPAEVGIADLAQPHLVFEINGPGPVTRKGVAVPLIRRRGVARTPPKTITTVDGVVHIIPPKIPYPKPSRNSDGSQRASSAGFVPGHYATSSGSGSVPPDALPSDPAPSVLVKMEPAAKSRRTKSPEPGRRAKPPPIIPNSTTNISQTLPTSLQIFDAPSTSALPTALRNIIDSSPSPLSLPSSPSPPPETGVLPNLENGTSVGDGDEMRKEAARGYEQTRLRATRARGEVVEKTGVSASGKGVKVGVSGTTNGTSNDKPVAKLGVQIITKKKGKGKADIEIPNQDFCSSCRGIGKFLCCDGCPRSFHFMCLNPPLRVDELPEEETWYCTQCKAERVKNRDAPTTPVPQDWQPRPIPMTFKALVKKVEVENPTQFRLPDDIRLYFVGVGTDPKTDVYLDVEEVRMKLDRKGYQEDRETTAQKLRRNIACYVCGESSLPRNALTTDPSMTLRAMVSCDYCALHWHLDCLDPPLASMPNSGRKWMCPNHVEHVMGRRRTIRNGMETIDVERRGQPNNGNIQIIPDESHQPRVRYEELLINKKKYRVPERIVRLDFWAKLGLGKGVDAEEERGPVLRIGRNGHKRQRRDSDSSLTSMDASDSSPAKTPTAEDMEAANLVLSLLGPRDESRAREGSTLSTGSPPSNPSIISLQPSRATSVARSLVDSVAGRSAVGRERKDSIAGRSKTGSSKDGDDVIMVEVKSSVGLNGNGKRSASGSGSGSGSGSTSGSGKKSNGTREQSAVPSTASAPVSGIPKITLRLNRPKDPSPVEKMVVDD